MSANQPSLGLGRLGEDQGLPDGFLVVFTERLLERRQQLLDQGQPPETAKEQATAEALWAFEAGVGERDWTVERRRLSSLAADTLGLEEEYWDQHGYPPQLARLSAIGEVLQGERARSEIPLPWRHDPDPARPRDPERRPGPARTPPERRTAAVRARAVGDER